MYRVSQERKIYIVKNMNSLSRKKSKSPLPFSNPTFSFQDYNWILDFRGGGHVIGCPRRRASFKDGAPRRSIFDHLASNWKGVKDFSISFFTENLLFSWRTFFIETESSARKGRFFFCKLTGVYVLQHTLLMLFNHCFTTHRSYVEWIANRTLYTRTRLKEEGKREE